MALQSNDLFVVQSQTDSQLYKLKLSDLDAYLEGSSGVQFRGTVDLNNGAAAQTPAVTLPAANGDLYIVAADASEKLFAHIFSLDGKATPIADGIIG